MPIQKITEKDLGDSLAVAHGTLRSVDANLFAVVRNEIFFLPAFFDHYRRLGVQQFLILDDRSSDGTREFLLAQPDCVMLASEFEFGRVVDLVAADGSTSRERAGTLLKKSIAQKYLMGKFALYFDADEFLVLPQGVACIAEIIETCQAKSVECVAASLIDMYPETLEQLSAKLTMRSFDDLIAAYRYFDAGPIVRLRPDRQPTKAGISAPGRLFRQYGIKEPRGQLSWLPPAIADLLPFPEPRTPWLKTPLVHWTDKVWLAGSHKANVPPASDMLLAIIHFKFTCDFERRVKAAVAQRSHFRGSQAYRSYHRLLQRLRSSGGSFIGPSTRAFHGPEDFAAVGLSYWPDVS